jgi:hypothetical protein
LLSCAGFGMCGLAKPWAYGGNEGGNEGCDAWGDAVDDAGDASSAKRSSSAELTLDAAGSRARFSSKSIKEMLGSTKSPMPEGLAFPESAQGDVDADVGLAGSSVGEIHGSLLKQSNKTASLFGSKSEAGGTPARRCLAGGSPRDISSVGGPIQANGSRQRSCEACWSRLDLRMGAKKGAA